MAHIFKHPKEDSKGIVVISHQEAERGLNHYSDMMNRIGEKYFIGIHYGGFSKGVRYPGFADFFMGRSSVTDISQRYPDAFEIPIVSSNFTSTVFKKDSEVKKYWDIINISRAANIKRLDGFFREIKKIYNKGYKYKVLLISPKRHEDTPEDHFMDIEDVYYDMFSKEERQWFTLMRLAQNLEFKGLSKTQLSYFYQSSKCATLFSDCEGSPGVVAEALLTEIPVVMYAGQLGSGRDLLTGENSVTWQDYNNAHECLIQAVENHDKFVFDTETLANAYREDKGLEHLKLYFEKLYSLHGEEFDGELINTDDLVSRLPSHYTELPWVDTRLYNGHMTKSEHYETFCKELKL
tara:strand:- start:1269 stop:2318 length:1050 start_codon:yes stop_codon:yes gene_type:complete